MSWADDRPHVVVVGAGFGGLTLAKELGHDERVRLTVVDRHNFHTFQPLLYQVATAGLGEDDIASAVRGVVPGAHFRLGTVTGADLTARELQFETGPPLRYDKLVLAAGASTATFGVPGVERFAFGMKSLPEALALRNHVLERFELVAEQLASIDDGALNFVIVGGGATGVELAGSLAELVFRVLRKDYPTVDIDRAEVIVLEAADRLLGAFSYGSASYALWKLRQMGVDVRLRTSVAEVTAEGVQLGDGDVIRSQTVVWVAGVRANPLADVLDLPQTRGGRIVVQRDLTVPDHADVFAIGDVAATPGKGDTVLPQLAPVAIQSARLVARNIRRQLGGKATRPFSYFDKGTMATIGRNAAVAELPLGIKLRGFVAWVAWLGLHLIELVSFRNRLNVLVNWSWNYLTWDRGARLIVAPIREEGEAP